MTDYGFISLIPPLTAILLALLTRQVILSLLAGILMGAFIISPHPINGFLGFFQAIVQTFSDAGNTRVVIFVIMVGGMMELISRSGGWRGISQFLLGGNLITTKKRAEFSIFFTGVIIFIESTITIIITGTLGRVFKEKFKLTRAKIAYLCDSTSAPVCMLIPLNAWGAYVIGLLGQNGVEEPFSVFIGSIFHNYYAWMAIAVLLFIIITGKDFGPMKTYPYDEVESDKLMDENPYTHASLGAFFLPIALLLISVPLAMIYTGFLKLNGDGTLFNWLTSGSGSTSVLVGVTLSGVGIISWSVFKLKFSLSSTIEHYMNGCGKYLNLGLLMVTAFAIGQISKDLGTGKYLASLLVGWEGSGLLVVMIFILSSVIAFSTGTSWGTFGIMIPLVMPLVSEMNLPVEAVVGAVLSGGIFGDHTSPISDTTVISSMAAGCDVADHVNTQMPYALVAGGLSILLFMVL